MWVSVGFRKHAAYKHIYLFIFYFFIQQIYKNAYIHVHTSLYLYGKRQKAIYKIILYKIQDGRYVKSSSDNIGVKIYVFGDGKLNNGIYDNVKLQNVVCLWYLWLSQYWIFVVVTILNIGFNVHIFGTTKTYDLHVLLYMPC